MIYEKAKELFNGKINEQIQQGFQEFQKIRPFQNYDLPPLEIFEVDIWAADEICLSSYSLFIDFDELLEHPDVETIGTRSLGFYFTEKQDLIRFQVRYEAPYSEETLQLLRDLKVLRTETRTTTSTTLSCPLR